MSSDPLHAKAHSVASRAEFVSFVDDLRQECLEQGGGWENDTLERFLGGLAGFSKSISGYYKNMGENVDPEQITWRMAAQMLLATNLYE